MVERCSHGIPMRRSVSNLEDRSRVGVLGPAVERPNLRASTACVHPQGPPALRAVRGISGPRSEVSPILSRPWRDLTAADVTPWLAARTRNFSRPAGQSPGPQGVPAQVHRMAKGRISRRDLPGGEVHPRRARRTGGRELMAPDGLVGGIQRSRPLAVGPCRPSMTRNGASRPTRSGPGRGSVEAARRRPRRGGRTPAARSLARSAVRGPLSKALIGPSPRCWNSQDWRRTPLSPERWGVCRSARTGPRHSAATSAPRPSLRCHDRWRSTSRDAATRSDAWAWRRLERPARDRSAGTVRAMICRSSESDQFST